MDLLAGSGYNASCNGLQWGLQWLESGNVNSFGMKESFGILLELLSHHLCFGRVGLGVFTLEQV